MLISLEACAIGKVRRCRHGDCENPISNTIGNIVGLSISVSQLDVPNSLKKTLAFVDAYMIRVVDMITIR